MARLLRSLLICLLFALPSVRAIAEDSDLASLNLRDVDIRVLIDTVAEATGRNFLVDPRVKAKVTLVSAKPMQKDELYDVFLSILELHGFSAVPAGKVIKIVPDANAKQEAVPTLNDHIRESGDQLVTQIIEVKYVSAAQLVPILRPLIPQQGHLAAYPGSNVLIISDRAANVRRITDIVRRIDRAETGEVEVIPLEHASATELVKVLTALMQQNKQATQGAAGPVLIADERTNSILMTGDLTARLRLRAIIAHLDIPLESGGNTQVVFLRYARAKDMAAILQGTATGQSQQKPGAVAAPATATGSKVDIQPDEVNNALVITAPQDVLRGLLSVIRQLDVRRAQVLVEAIIAEISTDKSGELGVQYGLDTRKGTQRGSVSISNFMGKAGASLLSLSQDPTQLGNEFAVSIADLTPGVTNWAVLLQALAADTATNILSTPSILTMDNQEAEIVVGQNVPFLTGSYSTVGVDGSVGSGSPVSSPFQTIQRQDVGITLKVRPQVNLGKSMLLEIQQEVSGLIPPPAGVNAQDVVTNKRSIKTTVSVEDGQVVVLGGLIEDTYKDNVSKIPLLGDVPVLGHLFRYDTTEKQKQNLMVFIHPLIVRDGETAQVYSGEKYDLLRSRQAQSAIHQRGLMSTGAEEFPERLEQIRGMLAPLQQRPGDSAAPARPAVESPVPH